MNIDRIDSKVKLGNLLEKLRSLFNLRSDTDETQTVDYIRANVDFKSASAWTLVFAIFIASVGLNTNSAAVVIGAMLISPLMGPIVGTGLGLGIHDFKLLKRSLRNLGFAVVISILASTLYFFLSPLSDIQSELLARTRPSFFDVIIALFGGAAGIIAVSRQEKGNVIPGVAIATAVMPPLCTAGFGLANGEIKYFFGALYLFVINSVFICISTFIFVRYLRFKKASAATEVNQRKMDKWVSVVAVVVIIPSLLFAWLLQREDSFRSVANKFINSEMKFGHSFIVDRNIDYAWSHPKIRVDIIGETLSPDQISSIKSKMVRYSLDPSILEVRQSSIEENLERRLSEKLSSQDNVARQTDLKLAQAEVELQIFKGDVALSEKVTNELAPLFSRIRRIVITENIASSGQSTQKGAGLMKSIMVLWKSRPDKKEKERISEFLARRVETTSKVIDHVVDL